MNKFTFHSLAVPHNIANDDFVACAYQQKCIKFAKMMTDLGHKVITYGVEGMKTQSSEEVVVVDTKTFEKVYGDHEYRQKFFKYDTNDEVYQTFYRNAITEIGKRKKPLDFIIPHWGVGHKPICDSHQDIISVESGIGYGGGSWTKWRAYESYAILHAAAGLEGVRSCKQDWYHTVIPNYFDLNDFTYNDRKEDYYLFLGRVYAGKGIDVAVQVTEAIGAKLIVAGQNPDNLKFPKHVEFVGYADKEKRRMLMSNAKAGIYPSMYVGPFEGVSVETLLSGTPIITTNWGCYSENNIHGLTGYRCNTFDQFCYAAENSWRIKPSDCRKFGENFSLENVGPMFEEFYQMIYDVYTGKGWYQRHPERKNLKWLERQLKI